MTGTTHTIRNQTTTFWLIQFLTSIFRKSSRFRLEAKDKVSNNEDGFGRPWPFLYMVHKIINFFKSCLRKSKKRLVIHLKRDVRICLPKGI